MELNSRQFLREFAQQPRRALGPRQMRAFDPGPEVDAAAAAAARTGKLASRFGDVRVETTIGGAEGILQTGDIRTQFETHDSGGFYDPGYRDRVEREGLGYDSNPVYGYLARNPSDRSEYGDVTMTLKPSVKERSTLYPDDAWYAFEEHEYAASAAAENDDPAPQMTPPTPLLEGLPMKDGERGLVEAHILAGEKTSQRSANPEPWDDIPVSSRVPVDEISRVQFELPREGSTRDWEVEDRRSMMALGEQFTRRGASVSYLEDQEEYQPPLPFSEPELTDQGFTQDIDLGSGSAWTRRPAKARPYSPPENVRRTQKRTRHEDLQGRDRWGSD